MAEPTFFTPDMEASLRPRLETIFVNTRPMVSAATSPVAASPAMMQAPRLTAAEILNRARAAVLARRREQQQQGAVPYIPAQPAIVDDVMRTTLSRANLPQPSMSRDVTTVQQRPTGGVIVNYGPRERAIKGQYGVGSATSEKKGPTMIEGMPAAKWFQEAANRQGQRIVVGGYDRGSIFEPKTKKEA